MNRQAGGSTQYVFNRNPRVNRSNEFVRGVTSHRKGFRMNFLQSPYLDVFRARICLKVVCYSETTSLFQLRSLSPHSKGHHRVTRTWCSNLYLSNYLSTLLIKCLAMASSPSEPVSQLRD